MARTLDEPNTDEKRRSVRAALDGRAWAESVRADLAGDGRPAAGGWPGTLSEARAKVDANVDRNRDASPSERERLTRMLYQSARTFWLENRVPHVPDPTQV
jgi:hypothetical protein